MPPAALPGVDAGFEQRLIDGVRPIAEHFLASALHHLFNTGLYDALAAASGRITVDHVATDLDLDQHRLRTFFAYLANEGIVTFDGDQVGLTEKAHRFAEFRAWYTLLVGGYSRTLDQLGDALRTGAGVCSRNGRYVGLGSCDMAAFDGMPMTRSLLDRAGVASGEVLDLGCGNARYLVELCRRNPGLRAWGGEPDPGGFAAAQALVAEAGLGDRINLVNVSATQFLTNPPAACRPDLAVFGYVLQEVLGQSGEDAVVDLLRSTVERFPRINIVVIEVAHEVAKPDIMGHGVARNFWNAYYLIHPFTNQRLETREYWELLFDKAGLTVHGAVTTPRQVDSTGIELGYLLRGPGYAAEGEAP